MPNAIPAPPPNTLESDSPAISPATTDPVGICQTNSHPATAPHRGPKARSMAPEKPPASGRCTDSAAKVSAMGAERRISPAQANREPGPAVRAAMAGSTSTPVPSTEPA